jgi:hypothetical protein
MPHSSTQYNYVSYDSQKKNKGTAFFNSLHRLVLVTGKWRFHFQVRSELLILHTLTSVYKSPRHGSGDYPAACHRRGIFDPGAVRIRFVVDQVSLWPVYLRPLRYSCVSIIPPMLHSNLNLDTCLRRTSGQSVKTFKIILIIYWI